MASARADGASSARRLSAHHYARTEHSPPHEWGVLVTVFPTDAGGEPCSGGSDQRSRTGHKSENDSRSARARNVVPRISDGGVDPALSVWWGQTGTSANEANQVIPIFRCNSSMARGSQQHSSRFGAHLRDVGICAASLTSEQTIDIERDKVLPCDRRTWTCCAARRRGDPSCRASRQD
jgi:hypothetical protein